MLEKEKSSKQKNRKKENSESTATNARKNIYFSKENLDLYEYLTDKGYKGTEFACRAIRKLMEEEMTEDELGAIENPTASTVLVRIKLLEESQRLREEKLIKEMAKMINQSLVKELSVLKDSLRKIEAKLENGVYVKETQGNSMLNLSDELGEEDDILLDREPIPINPLFAGLMPVAMD